MYSGWQANSVDADQTAILPASFEGITAMIPYSRYQLLDHTASWKKENSIGILWVLMAVSVFNQSVGCFRICCEDNIIECKNFTLVNIHEVDFEYSSAMKKTSVFDLRLTPLPIKIPPPTKKNFQFFVAYVMYKNTFVLNYQ